MDGNVREEEVLNQSQIFITTAGYKSTYSYEKLIQLLVRMTTRGDAIVMGYNLKTLLMTCGMTLLSMKHHLDVNMKVNGLVLLKMLSSMVIDLTDAASWYSLKRRLLVEVVS